MCLRGMVSYCMTISTSHRRGGGWKGRQGCEGRGGRAGRDMRGGGSEGRQGYEGRGLGGQAGI